MQIIYLVASSQRKPWRSLVGVQKNTWVRSLPKNQKAFFLFGNGILGTGSADYLTLHDVNRPNHERGVFLTPISNTPNDSDLFFDSLDGWEQLLSNTLSGMSYLLDRYNFDYLIRTNNSTYFNPKKLEQRLSQLQDSGLYAGPQYSHQGINYVGGYSIILSKDLVQQLVNESSRIHTRIIDDVAIGMALNELGVGITALPEVPWVRLRELPAFSRRLRSMYQNTFAFRCKAEIVLPSNFFARRLKINPVKIRLDRIIFCYVNWVMKRYSQKKL